MNVDRRGSRQLLGTLSLLLVLLAVWVPASAQVVAADPLPSWNDGQARRAILSFVAEVTDESSISYVPPAARVAVFDNDGTLWTEKPVPVQAAFAFQRVADLVPKYPEWETTQPYEAVLAQDMEALRSWSAEEIEQLILDTHSGMAEKEFEAEAKAFLETARHPRFDLPYTDTVYQPMLELIAYLQDNDFKTFIVSGGGTEFMRTYAEEIYGIPRENVIGSLLQYAFEQTPAGSNLIREPETVAFVNESMKPVAIQRHIGRRPILAVGNSDGDLEMLQFTAGGTDPYLNLLLVHDDADREYAYVSDAEEAIAAATENAWVLVSVKNDFESVYPASALSFNTTTPTAGPTARVPLQDALSTLEPQQVWQNFYALTQIPRPSHHEEKVRDFLVQFGQDLGLVTTVDDAGNVIIRKPAAPGKEDLPGVILQAHMDMVPQKTPDSPHDFLTDPIDAYVDGDWIVTDGTTLGADDGIGIAMAMAVLQSDTPSLGPLELLFTVNEEDGMDGALGLQPGMLQGSLLINLDSEEEGIFTIGSAGGELANIETSYAESEVPADVTAYEVTVSGLKGGHSGVDIHRGRGHAIKLLVRFLNEAAVEHDLRLAQITGGAASNAIPRDAMALLVVPTAQVDPFLKSVEGFEATVRSELALVDPDIRVQAVPAELPAKVMDEEFQRLLLDLLYAAPQGVMRMSDAVSGLVETSTNLGILTAADGQLDVTCLSRSSVDSQLADVDRMIASVWDLAGIDVTFSDNYSGWNPDPDSPILLQLQEAYQALYGQEPAVMAVHAGLECGTIVSQYPGMDAISIGPTLQNVHSPDERLEIATVGKVYDLVLETLTSLDRYMSSEAVRQIDASK